MSKTHPTLERLKELTRALLAGEIDRRAAAERAEELGPSNPFQSTFSGPEASGHHLLMTRCAANRSNPREDGPPYFFRDSDIQYSLEQMDGINVVSPIADGVVQERIWTGPMPSGPRHQVYLGTLKLSPEQLEAQTKVRFIRGIDDLEVELFVNLRMRDRPCRLMSRPQLGGVDLVCFEETREAQLEVFRLALEALCLDLSDFQDVAEHLDTTSLPEWVLWRQDDNGNRFDVRTFTSRSKAEREAEKFGATQHKQTYGVR